MKEVSVPEAIKAAKRNHKASCQRIQHLQAEYLRDVVHGALRMLGYAGDEKSGGELLYWSGDIRGHTARYWVERYMKTHERTGPPKISRKDTPDYDPEMDPADMLSSAAGLRDVASLVKESGQKRAQGREGRESSEPGTGRTEKQPGPA